MTTRRRHRCGAHGLAPTGAGLERRAGGVTMRRSQTGSSETDRDERANAMSESALVVPSTDPTPIFEIFRGNHGTELLTAAVAHLDVFGRLAAGPRAPEELSAEIGLEARPSSVLFTALRAFGLLRDDDRGRLEMTPMALEHLAPGGAFDVGGYIGLAAESPGVVEMVERLRTNRPAGASAEDRGAAFIFREGIESAMEREASARQLTLALAGRARNVAPVLAENYPLDGARLLLD